MLCHYSRFTGGENRVDESVEVETVQETETIS